jgi:pilus assembly protein CpaB
VRSLAVLRRKWPASSKALLAAACACGLVAFGLTRGYESRITATRPDVGPPVSVVVAAGDVTRGATLDEGSVTTTAVPRSLMPPGALTQTARAVGRVVLTDLADGEVVTGTRLAARAAGPVAALVPPGEQAFVVPTGVPAGAIVAGDHIDVLATFGGANAHTETVATGLEVLSVLAPAQDGGALSVGAGATSGEQLVLIVLPDQAESLAYATSFGEISVTIDGATEVMPSATPSAA